MTCRFGKPQKASSAGHGISRCSLHTWNNGILWSISADFHKRPPPCGAAPRLQAAQQRRFAARRVPELPGDHAGAVPGGILVRAAAPQIDMPAETEHRLTADAAKAGTARIFGFAIRRRRYPERRRQAALALIGEAPGPGLGRAALGGQRPRQAIGAERMRAPIGIDRQPRRRRHERAAERAPQHERRKNLRQCFGEARDRLAISFRFQVLPRRHSFPQIIPQSRATWCPQSPKPSSPPLCYGVALY